MCAGSNVVATFCQYEALKYVSFPVQTLGKCAKMIPVMIWGSLVNQKSYKGKDYFIAMMITVGCVLFAMTGVWHLLTKECTIARLVSTCSVRCSPHWCVVVHCAAGAPLAARPAANDWRSRTPLH